MLLPNATSKALNLNSSSSSHDYFPVAQRLYQSAAIAHNLTNLTVSDCVQAYSPTFQTTYGGLILVTSNSSFKQQSFYFQNNDVGCASDPVYWLCGRDSCMQPYEVDYRACTADGVDTADWQPFGSRVDYCLAETLDQKCKVQLTPNLAYVVVVVNLMKAAILAFTFFSMKENPMMTIGDAVASFLRRKDQTTKNLCLMGKGDVKLWTHGQVHPRPMHVGSKRRRWGSVISKSRWTVFILL